MIKVEKSIVIDRSAQEVFAYVSDHTNAPRWQRGLLEVRRETEGPIGVGTRHTLVRAFMGRRMEASNEFTEYQPTRLVSFKVTADSMAAQGWYIVELMGSGHTKLTSRIEMQASGLIRLAQPLMAASLSREVVANLSDLKRLLEADVEARSVPSRGMD
jgi:uncharacterized protein YndB with AHSA1/START domain